jgi:3-dehydroquinate synthetase
MAAETRFAVEEGICSPDVLQFLVDLLTRFDLPVSYPGLDPAAVLGFMQQDKKRAQGRMRFALPIEVGRGRLVSVEPAAVQRAVTLACCASPKPVTQTVRGGQGTRGGVPAPPKRSSASADKRRAP